MLEGMLQLAGDCIPDSDKTIAPDGQDSCAIRTEVDAPYVSCVVQNQPCGGGVGNLPKTNRLVLACGAKGGRVWMPDDGGHIPGMVQDR